VHLDAVAEHLASAVGIAAERGDRVAFGLCPLDEAAADQSGGAGDENLHGCPIITSR